MENLTSQRVYTLVFGMVLGLVFGTLAILVFKVEDIGLIGMSCMASFWAVFFIWSVVGGEDDDVYRGGIIGAIIGAVALANKNIGEIICIVSLAAMGLAVSLAAFGWFDKKNKP